MSELRGIEQRIRWFLAHRPLAAGMCANHVYRALDAPLQGLPDATAVYRAVPASRMRTGPAPRGTVHYWTGGKDGHGHVAISTGDGRAVSVDVLGPRTVGTVPFGWFAEHWGNLRYKGWSWYWGRIDTQPKGDDMGSASDGYLSLKDTTSRPFTTGQTVPIDIAGVDVFRPERPGGRHTLALYANLELPPALVDGKPNPQRRWLHNGGVRAWFQQASTAESDGWDETGYDGPRPLPLFGDQKQLISHVWPHTADADGWQFCVKVYAFDDDGKRVEVPLTLWTREIKIIDDKT